jgi:hypothetical protein
MASTDARPIPKKNVAYRVTFPILDADGDLVTGATSPDSEVSKDGGTFADCTNEATEIATASGMYYLDLTSTEMNADTVAVIVKSGTGKTTPIVLYPEEAGDIRVDVTQISGDTTAADNCELMFDGTGYAGGTTKLGVDTVAISGDTTAADNCELDYDGTGYAKTNSTVGTVTTLTGHTVQTGDSFARLGAPAGASVSADVAAVKAETANILTDTGTTLDTKLNDIQGATFSSATDSLEAIRDRGDAAWTTGGGGADPALLQNTTIATLSTQVSFTLTAGSADDDAYNGCIIVITDASTSTQKAVGVISDYTGASKTVTLLNDPGVFVMAATDTVDIIADRSVKPATDNRNLTVDANGRTDVGAWLGTAVTTSSTSAKPEVDAFSISDDQTAANNCELDYDGTGYAKANSTVGTVTALTGHTAQTGDSFARIGAAGASLTDLGGMSTGMKAEVNAEADTALTDIGLDHMVSAAVIGADITDNSIIAKLASKSATADWDSYNNTTDSHEAIADGTSITDILQVTPMIPISIDLAETATWRIGVQIRNALDDLPTAGEITPGTISIARKAKGGTSWAAIETDQPCSEAAGMIYYDEVFNSGAGYADGDTVRFFFKSQKITVGGNDHEIFDATVGAFFYTTIRGAAQTGDSFVRIGAGGASLTDLGGMSTGMKAEVNAEVADVTDTDTNSELTAVPAVGAPLRTQIQWLYELARNKRTTTSTQDKVFKDDTSTTLGTSTISDSAGTFTRGEYA